MEMIVRHRDETVTDHTYHYHEIESLTTNQLGSRQAHDIVFVTGNKNKVAELLEHIKPKLWTLSVLDLDVTEIQDSNSLNIVEDKCRKAFQQVNSTVKQVDGEVAKRKCVLIEDTSLHFKAFNGLPGPYIKWFLKAVGPGGLYKTLEGFDDKSAEAVCTYALMEDESRVIFFKGSVRGRITKPRGESWGWDPIFEEERTGSTFGEMSKETKSKFSHRANAITILKKYLAHIH